MIIYISQYEKVADVIEDPYIVVANARIGGDKVQILKDIYQVGVV